MIWPGRSRRSFLKASVLLATSKPLVDRMSWAQSRKPGGPLVAYVGTFSSPLRDVLPTQVDRPPGNGRGIHLFYVNRADRGNDASWHPRHGHEPELPRFE